MRTSGTTSTFVVAACAAVCAAVVVAAGVRGAEIRCAAAYVSAVVASSHTAVSASRRGRKAPGRPIAVSLGSGGRELNPPKR